MAENLSLTQYQVLKKLGDLAQIPVLAVRYVNDFSKFNVVPVNEKSKEFLPQRTAMTESEFVTLLYRLRGINSVPKNILKIFE